MGPWTSPTDTNPGVHPLAPGVLSCYAVYMRTIKASDLTTDHSLYGHGKVFDALADKAGLPPGWRAEIESISYSTTEENHTDLEVSVNFSGSTYTRILTVPDETPLDVLDK